MTRKKKSPRRLEPSTGVKLGLRIGTEATIIPTDKRAFHIRETVEAEAMPARILRELLRTNIEGLLPERALDIAKVEEQSARDYFDRIAEITGDAA